MVKIPGNKLDPPEFWDAGIAGFILDYNVYAASMPHITDTAPKTSAPMVRWL